MWTVYTSCDATIEGVGQRNRFNGWCKATNGPGDTHISINENKFVEHRFWSFRSRSASILWHTKFDYGLSDRNRYE